MNEHVSELVETETEAHRDALSWDIQITEDKLNFSSWILALATAGLGLVITAGPPLILRARFPWASRGTLLICSVLFVASLIVGAYTKRSGYELIGDLRRKMTYWLKQRLKMMEEALDLELSGLRSRITAFEFLNPEDREKCARLSTPVTIWSTLDRCLAVQLGLVACAFSVFAAAALLLPVVSATTGASCVP
jgi:hypothetical protein